MNKNVKRTLLAVMVSSMLAASFSAIPVAADDTSVIATSVESEGVVTLGDQDEQTAQTAESINSAIASANSAITITLENDITGSIAVPANKVVTLDLAGYDIDLGSTTLYVDGTLTIVDSTASSLLVNTEVGTVTYLSGVIKSSDTVIIPRNGGKVVLESGTIYSTGDCGFYVNGDLTPAQANPVNSSLTVNGGFVHAREYGIGVGGRGAILNVYDGAIMADDNAAIAGNGTNNSEKNYSGTTINIAGGTIMGHTISSGYIASGIYHPQEGELNITGGSIYAYNGVGILMRGGELNLQGGTITASGTASGKVGDSNVIANCYGIEIEARSGYYDAASMNASISGGTISASEGVAAVNGLDINDNQIDISGGSYSSAIEESYLSENVEATVTKASGRMVVYTDIQNAVNAASAGDTVSVKQDKLSATVDPNKGIKFEVPANVTDINLTTPSGEKVEIGTDGSTVQTTFTATVNNVSTSYTKGQTVTISTSEYYNGHVFKNWVVSSGNVTLANPYSATTTFVMPAENVTVYAVYDEVTFVPVLPEQPTVTAPARDGWVKIGARWYLYDNGEKLTGWQKDGNTWYYLDEKGIMLCGGLTEIDGQTYYFYDWGGMASSWWYEDEDGNWFYFRGNGAMATSSWIEWKGEYYYVGADGKMLTNTTTPDGYRVDANGVWVR